MNHMKTGSKAAVYGVLIIGIMFMILPFLWMFLTSVKTVSQSTSLNPFYFFPVEWHWENYTEVLRKHNFMRLYYNTFATVAVREITCLLFSSMAAYAFARLKFPLKNFLFSLVLIQMMVPNQIFIIPQYLIINRLEMRNTVFALVFPGIVSAFGTFLLRQFFMGIPKELEEAAKIDGASIGRIYLTISLPLVKPGLAALAIFTAIFGFKDMMWPLIVNTDIKHTTLSAALAMFSTADAVNYPELMAAAVLAVIPMIVIYFVFQKQFVEGISTSGIK